MPFYEYECDNCKFYTELLQKISDPPLKKCPSCGKSTMKKLVSAPVFRLKGGGWYETDFKSDKEGKRNLAVEKEPESAADSKTETKTESADTKTADKKPADAKVSESKPAADAKPSSGSGSRGRARPAAKSKSAARSRAKPAAKRRKSR
jgi:putative FmdB family regulatory protein